MSDTSKEKILGCLLGASVGDAMGAATECRSTEQIVEYFGGYVTIFKNPPKDTFGRCNTAGMCTDDFIQGKYILDALLDNNGVVDDAVMKKGFKRWLEYPYYVNFTGPTTRAALQKIFGDSRKSLQGSLEEKETPVKIINDGNSKATNGGAMKIYSIAILNLGNIDKVILDAMAVTKFTHNNTLAISGACAVAAAISEALTMHCNLNSIYQAAMYGAEKGYLLSYAADADKVSGPSVAARIPLAISIGKKYEHWQKALKELCDIIGNGLHVSETVPVAFGCIAASQENAMNAIFASVNVGNDTDTIAIMAGAIMGAYQGVGAFPKNYLNIINKKNNFNLSETADRILRYLKTK